MPLFPGATVWYIYSPSERGCLPPLTTFVPRDLGRFSKLWEKERTMGKGNNSQKNDKKNKKVKKGDKKPDSKTTEKKR